MRHLLLEQRLGLWGERILVTSGQQSILQFGPFQLDSANWELRKNGQRISLGLQGFKALTFLATHSGVLVTREELSREIWGPDTFVDFDQGLNFCVWTLRTALGDDAKKPQYIETVARRGYRFLSQVTHPRETSFPGEAPPQGKWTGTAPGIYRGGRCRLALSYFRDLTGDQIAESLAAALRELLLAELVADGSLMLVQPSREVTAEAVLEGALVCSADRILLVLRVADRRSGEYVWASRRQICIRGHSCRLENVAASIVAELREKLLPVAFSQRNLTSRSEIDETYFQARLLCERRTEENLGRAIRLFEFVGKKSPGFAPAFSGQALAAAVLAGMSRGGRSEWEGTVCARARRALELDPGQAEAYAALALMENLYKLEWADARRALEKAIELDGNRPTSHQWLSMVLAAQGQRAQALQEIRLARWLDPDAPIITANYILFLYLAEQYEKAMKVCRQACTRYPTFPWLRMQLGLLLEKRLRPQEALAEMEKAARFSNGQANMLAGLCRAYICVGNRGQARETLGRLKSGAAEAPISAYGVAACYTVIGETEEAIEWLGRACERKEPTVAMLPVDPLFDGLWDDRRFKALARQFGCGCPTGRVACPAPSPTAA